MNMNVQFGAPTTENPRPYKCDDCKCAFRIHGHLAKHLRSKIHITTLGKFIGNKVGYTATPVACGWAEATFEVTKSFGQEQ